MWERGRNRVRRAGSRRVRHPLLDPSEYTNAPAATDRGDSEPSLEIIGVFGGIPVFGAAA